MAIEGNLEVFQLPEILQMIAAQRKTGILTVQGESDIVAVSFKEGQVVAADALNQTVEEGLGQILASQGLVSPRDFASVTAEHEAGGKRLLDILLERGHVHRSQLLEALRLQTYRLLLQLLRWQQGEFKFYSGDEVAFEEGFYAISVEELLIRSLSDLGEDGQGALLPELDGTYELTPSGAPIRYVAEGAAPPGDGSAVWLAPEDRVLVERLDGRSTARELAVSTGVGEYRVLFTLYRLLRGGAVRPVGHEPTHSGRAGAARPAPGGAAPSRSGAVAAPAPAPRFGSAAPALLPGTDLDELADADAVADVQPAASRTRPQAARRPRLAELPAVAVVLPALVATFTAAAVLATLWLAPRYLLLPFPWQSGYRASLERGQRAARYLQIDRAARTHFLLEGRYPDQLGELVTAGLLPGSALGDPSGGSLAYSADEVSYELQPVRGGEPLPALGAREAITGDFLLDPDFLQLPDRPEKAPLVLLD